MTDDAYAIIARCTRCGKIMWQHVANQMGRSVESVRQQFDQTYGAKMVCEAIETDNPLADDSIIDFDRISVARVKPLPLREKFLIILAKHTASAATLATITNTTLGTAKWQLSTMKADGLVTHTARQPYTWSIAVRQAGPANSSVEGAAA